MQFTGNFKWPFIFTTGSWVVTKGPSRANASWFAVETPPRRNTLKLASGLTATYTSFSIFSRHFFKSLFHARSSPGHFKTNATSQSPQHQLWDARIPALSEAARTRLLLGL